jgi:hypothetical protein
MALIFDGPDESVPRVSCVEKGRGLEGDDTGHCPACTFGLLHREGLTWFWVQRT